MYSVDQGSNKKGSLVSLSLELALGLDFDAEDDDASERVDFLCEGVAEDVLGFEDEAAFEARRGGGGAPHEDIDAGSPLPLEGMEREAERGMPMNADDIEGAPSAGAGTAKKPGESAIDALLFFLLPGPAEPLEVEEGIDDCLLAAGVIARGSSMIIPSPSSPVPDAEVDRLAFSLSAESSSSVSSANSSAFSRAACLVLAASASYSRGEHRSQNHCSGRTSVEASGSSVAVVVVGD